MADLDVDAILDLLAEAGVTVEVLGDWRVGLRPMSRVTDEVHALIREHGRALVAALSVPRTPCTCGCRWFWRLRGRRWRCWRCDFAAVPDEPAVEVESVLCDDGVIRRPQPRPVRYRCGVCGSTYPESADGASWIPSLAGGSWPRCPECTARGRTPDPPARPRPRRARGG